MTIQTKARNTGVLLGGSGLIGGAITHYFKTMASQEIEILAPNSKKLSLRVSEDIKQYFKKIKPNFIINAAISPIDSAPQLALETNYIGCINLAKAALSLKIPYIHLSSAATMPNGNDLSEDDHLTLSADLANYPKSKLMAELTLRHLWESEGLDCTILRLAVVYGKHDHKIQGFQRLLFSIADQAIPFMMTQKGVMHSYSNTKKLPPFLQYILNNRPEFTGQIFNFVDPQPVELSKIIMTIKAYLQLDRPKGIYIPYPVAKLTKSWLRWIMAKLSNISIEARMPAELMFLENFYQSQTLSALKLINSSYRDQSIDATVFSELPDMIEYYLTRWEHLNLISSYNESFYHPKMLTDDFTNAPVKLMGSIINNEIEALADFSDLTKNQGRPGEAPNKTAM